MRKIHEVKLHDLQVCTIITVSVLIDLSLTVKAATLIFISGRGSAISSAKEGKSGPIYIISFRAAQTCVRFLIS